MQSLCLIRVLCHDLAYQKKYFATCLTSPVLYQRQNLLVHLNVGLELLPDLERALSLAYCLVSGHLNYLRLKS